MEFRMKMSAMIKRLLSLLKPYWKIFGLVCLIGLVNSAIEMIPPKLVGTAIDLMTQDSKFEIKSILWICLGWAVCATVVQLLLGIQIQIANHYGEKVLANLRQKLFVHLQSLSMSFFDRTNLGSILAIHSSDIDAIRNVLIWGLNTMVANATVMIFSAVMLYHTNSELFFATVWLFPALLILNFTYGRKITRAWDQVRQHSSLVGSNQTENIAGVKVVHAFNRQNDNLEHYNQLQETNTSNNISAAKRSGLFQPFLQWIRFVGVAIILILGGFKLSHHELQAGSLVTALLYWDWFMNPAISFGSFFNELLVSLTGASRLFKLLDHQSSVRDVEGAQPLSQIEGKVQFENVSFRYHSNGRLILNNINFSVEPGSVVALVGGTGSGKSTIISLLNRFYQPFVGRVLVDDQDVRYVTGDSLHRQSAMVLQANFLFKGTILENLRYARPNVSLETVYEAAKTLGCHQRFFAMKNGYDTEVGERGSALSIGERQLVCFVRALVADPKILLLDEATSALDPHTAMQVQIAMHRLMKGRTTFIVTHRLSTVTNSDLILMLENGEIAESGTHTELMEKKGRYCELFSTSLSKSSLKSPAPVQA